MKNFEDFKIVLLQRILNPIIKQYIKELKHNSKCSICGEEDDCCLEFHHLDEKKKKFSIGKIPHTVTLEDVKKELEKTICVCANCHRKLHKGIISIPVRND